MGDISFFLDLEEINELSIRILCETAKNQGQDKVMWQHPLNKQVVDYCAENKYIISGLYTLNAPALYGQQYLIKFE